MFVASVLGRRAILEAALVAAALGVALLAVVPARNVDAVWAALTLGFFDVGLIGGAIAAIRARRSAGMGRRRALARELGLLLGTMVAVALAVDVAVAITHNFRPELDEIVPTAWLAAAGLRPGILLSFVAAAAVTGGSLQAFTVVRVAVVLWPRWNRLRQSRLVWSITHAQLVAVLVLATGAGLLLLTWFLAGERSPFGTDPDLQDPLVRPLIGFIAAVNGALVVVVVAAVVVLPIAAAVSYFALRPTTRRLDGLTGATGALREGDLDARVPVEGEDEVARLQADFNAMAEDLERSVGELERERDAVRRLLAARRELVTAVSHELRTPVATLRAYLDSSLEHWDGSPPATLRRDLEVMDREAARLERLIDDLFELSRAELGSLPLDVGPVDVGPVLARSVEAMRPLARDRSRVELVLAVPVDLEPVQADEGRLEQVVRNLLANGIRHTPPGGVIRVSAESVSQGDGTAGIVAIRVEDTGEGIAADELDRIWERFYRTDGSRDRDQGGAGLGLALVKELTEAMGGRVEATSTVGVGSRFSIHLPVGQVSVPRPG